MSAGDIQAAYKIVRAAQQRMELPPGMDIGDLLIHRIIEIGTGIPPVPPITILED
jgi:hypothetical protein